MKPLQGSVCLFMTAVGIVLKVHAHSSCGLLRVNLPLRIAYFFINVMPAYCLQRSYRLIIVSFINKQMRQNNET